MSSPSRSAKLRSVSGGSTVRRSGRISKRRQGVYPSTTRLLTVWSVLMGAMVLLAGNLFYVQVRQSSVLRKIAQDRQSYVLQPFVPRRSIVDRNGTVLALDRPAFMLYAHPKLFKESAQAIAEKLAPILNQPIPALLKTFREGESGLRVADKLSENAADHIIDLQVDGLELIERRERLYPQQQQAADVVGFVNTEHKGQAGIELSQQNLLERHTKEIRLSRMGDGSPMPDQVPAGFMSLDDLQLQLTIDLRLQRVAQQALQKQVKAFGAKRGTVIVMDARDGALLALATDPTYDPNQYSRFPFDRFKIWGVTDLYEPGSTFKPINVAIALETGAIQPNDVFNDVGQIFIDQWTIQNFDFSSAGGRGSVNVTDIIKYSSNVGMVRIVQQMKASLYYTWLKKIGLGSTTGIDLPSEAAGQVKDRKTFTQSPIEPATTAFGQGFSLTPIQLAQMHSSLANGGKLVTPHVLRGLYDSKGQLYWQPNLPPPKQVFSLKTTQAVLLMMEQVVQNGTAKNAQIPSYRIAGKTGTAQKAGGGGGYGDGKITSFVGIVPVNAPRYVIVAVVDEPQGGDAFGATVAAPVVKAVMEALISLEKIPPSPPVSTAAGNNG
ncbi:MAG: peptidoglycan D,D-transpeptidase FtsI family protein [Leptolyngbyaceae cyanobacterium]